MILLLLERNAMNRMLWPRNLKVYLKGVAVMGLIIPSGLMMLPVFAQSRLGFEPPSTGAPGNREAGANRTPTEFGGEAGGCALGEHGLVALMPAKNLAQTAMSHPTLYAYFPSNRAQFAEFILYEEGSNELVYGTLFNVTGDPGLVTLDIPDNATVAPLRVGQRYDWSLTLICNVRDRAEDMLVTGSFERVRSNINQQLQGVSVDQQPFIYAEAGLWPETLASLITASQSNRAVAEQNLQDLLTSVGYETELPNGPLLP